MSDRILDLSSEPRLGIESPEYPRYNLQDVRDLTLVQIFNLLLDPMTYVLLDLTSDMTLSLTSDLIPCLILDPSIIFYTESKRIQRQE